MAKGFLIESSIQATDVVALNRYAVSADTDFDGGTLVALTAPTAQGNDVWTAANPSESALTGLWVAYNPSYHITEIGTNQYAGISNDVRDYTNLKGRTFTVFKPQVGDMFVISVDCCDSDSQAATAGKFLESVANQSTWTQKDSATTGHTAVKVMHTVNIPFPATKGAIGFTKQAGYKVEVVAQ